MTYTDDRVQKVNTLLDDGKVKSIRLLFVDPLGRLKGQIVTRKEFANVLERGQGFDGSSIEGFVRIHESDKVLWPDLESFWVLPYSPGGAPTAVAFCNVCNADTQPFAGDSRWVLQRALDRAKSMDFDHFYCGPEIEYFYFRPDTCPPQTLDAEGYFSFTMTHEGDAARQEVVDALEAMDIHVEGHHHEVAPSQQEIDLRYSDALRMADIAVLYRMVVKDLAAQRQLWACFMPKPLFGENGSGMHVHQSLFTGEVNAFFDKDAAPYFLSGTARSYVAGIFRYIREYQLLLNQWVNSYKRLVPGFEAPVYVAWGQKNRSALVRIPEYQPGKDKATRIELRNADPGCNPYLAFAAMLDMGLHGIAEGLTLEDPAEDDLYHLDDAARAARNIRSLHGTLRGTMEDFQQSTRVRQLVGDHLFERLLASKRQELSDFNRTVHPYEIATYAPFL